MTTNYDAIVGHFDAYCRQQRDSLADRAATLMKQAQEHQQAARQSAPSHSSAAASTARTPAARSPAAPNHIRPRTTRPRQIQQLRVRRDTLGTFPGEGASNR
ncbi:hypothetical protein [Corynebacterium ulceribovis]|uniref:hypothetical protein n=1 Tax=Corynebacterium ulceribovis TaxID=487732 RepID=UPI000377B5DA|nr:hypothetical protein [Corynebacterium ulceribovis]